MQIGIQSHVPEQGCKYFLCTLSTGRKSEFVFDLFQLAK